MYISYKDRDQNQLAGNNLRKRKFLNTVINIFPEIKHDIIPMKQEEEAKTKGHGDNSSNNDSWR